MATRRRTSTSRASSTRRAQASRAKRASGSSSRGLSLGMSPAVGRSLVGIVLLVLGAVTLIALMLPGQGALTDWWRNLAVPYFGTGRWLLPFVLLLSGWYLEWGPGREPGAPWGRTLLGIAMAYVGVLGLMQLIEFSGQFTGGRIGRFLVSLLEPLLTTPGAFVIMLGLTIAGLLIAFDMPLRALLSPATRAAKAAGTTLQDRTTRAADTVVAAKAADSRATAEIAGVGVMADAGRKGKAPRVSPADSPGQTGVWGSDASPEGVPYGVNAPPPTSATIAPLRSPGGLGTGAAPAMAVAATALRDPEDVTDAADSPARREAIAWVLPPTELLDLNELPTAAAGATADAVHTWNEARIIEKLKSFDIDARIVGRNAGPVVTQYEVQPAPHIKVSRIEALSDDLSMALAARSIRIEAPIPGKSAVGIEVPNKEFNVVALRRILDEVDFRGSESALTFALGRDVAGKAMAVDLAKMPHLLIAGATGSGKSVMVNALITSLLCNATPDDTRMILSLIHI